MKVVVLGASGYLGSWIYHLFSNGTDAGIIGTNHTNNHNPDLIHIDVRSDRDREYLLKLQPDVLIWSLMSRDHEDQLVRQGLKPLIDGLSSDIKVLYISSDVFSEGEGNYTEEDIPTPIKNVNPLSVYANAKLEGERIVTGRNNHIVVRTGPIYGRGLNGRWDHRVSTLIDSLSGGSVIRRADNLYKTFVQVEQLAQAIVELVYTDYRGIIHLGPSSKESYYTFNVKMANRLNLDARLILPDKLDEHSARTNGIPLDTSLNTDRCRSLLQTRFEDL